jgi:hypothetical protein
LIGAKNPGVLLHIRVITVDNKVPHISK